MVICRDFIFEGAGKAKEDPEFGSLKLKDCTLLRKDRGSGASHGTGANERPCQLSANKPGPE